MAKGKAIDLPDDMQADWVLALNLPDIPPSKIGGKINPEHYRVRLAHINLVAEAAVKRGGAIPFNVESLTKMIEREASMAGLDATSISDARSEGDKILAAVNRLLDEGDKDTIFEQTDDDIDLLLKEMEAVVVGPKGAKNVIEDRQFASGQPERQTRGKKWLNRLRRVKRLREMARHPIPPSVKKETKDYPQLEAAWESSHILRYMLYVGRSSTISQPTEHGFPSHIYRFGIHHARFAVSTWEARTGSVFEDGKFKIRARPPRKGVILIAPPGHGKPLCVETPVTTSDGKKRLGDIVVGDKVQTHTGEYQKVTEIHEQGVLPTITITTAEGRVVVSALDHPFLTSGGWRYARELRVYDQLRVVVGNEIHLYDQIVSIEQHAPTKCRCLTVDVDHTFLANDIVVHNSEFASHYLALEINLRPQTQALYIHAIADKAQEQKAHVARLFTRESSAGRRNLSIWPHVLDKTDNNKTKMRLKLPERSKSPTVTSTGIMSAQLGADTNIQILDDIVPQSDVDQPTERDRRFKILSGTFGTRQRGQDTFRVVIGTFWHHDDALSRLWKIGDTSDLYVRSRQSTGGPNSSPPFRPLWPEVFPAAELRRRFDEMNHNISLWSANYMGNPITEEARLIKQLAYYDPDSMQHMDFMVGARCYVTVDPTATNKEKADKAGLVYVAVGDIQTDTNVNGILTTGWVTKARIVDYKQIHVNQVELADTVAHYALARPVHQVHVETRSGYHATADILQNKYGIEAVRHDPGPRNKEQRLKSCAGIIDNSLQGLQALVEFPGIPYSDGKLGPDEKHKPFYAQFLDFGYSPDDHCVDAVTQLLNYLLRSGTLVAGGEATVSVGKFPESRNPRMNEELDQYINPQPQSDKEHSDWSWFAQRSEAV